MVDCRLVDRSTLKQFIAVFLGCGLVALPAAAQDAEQMNMRLVGYSDLQARSAYQPVIHLQNGRSIAYVGHHGGSAVNPLTGAMESNGTSIVDVTDPSTPRALFHISGEKGQGESGGAQMVRLCNGSDLPRGDPAKTYLLRTYGNSAHQIWDVSAPERLALVVTVVAGLKDTHKSWWECDTGIAFLVSGLPDWRTRRMTQIFDISDPARPVHIRDFGLPGQQPGAGGTAPTELHGPISTGRGGNRVYFGYGTNRGGVVQIVDRDKLLNGPKAPTPANLAYPQVGRLELSPLVGAHTTFPLLNVEVPEFARDEHGRVRDFLVIVDESLRNECREEARQMVYFVDITAELRPFPVANYNVPEALGAFCSRGGRFGAHSSNENFTPVFYRRIMFFAWFNAGVRAVDVRDPFTPRELGYYIPATTDKTDKRCVKAGGQDRCKVAIQTNNVEVDERGYIYIVDRANTGMHILELTGEARRIANYPR